MGIDIAGSISEIKFMVLAYTTSRMATAMRVPGMRERNKVLACIPLEMGMSDQVNGIAGL
jgi:hypothetical protein